LGHQPRIGACASTRCHLRDNGHRRAGPDPGRYDVLRMPGTAEEINQPADVGVNALAIRPTDQDG
jgi:hypothetical protein